MKKIILMVLFVTVAIVSRTEAQSTVELTLEEARRIALQNHPQIKADDFNAQAARQITAQRNAARLPNLQADLTGAGAGPDDTIAAGAINNSSIDRRIAAGFQINQLVYDFGRTGNLVKNARTRADALEHSAEATRARTILEVDRAYFIALRAQTLLSVAEQTGETRRLVLEQTQALQERGIRSGLDVSMASYGLAEARLQLSRSQNDYRAAIARLSAAMGSREEHAFELADVLINRLPDRTDLVAEALDKRPDLRALRSDRDAARYFMQAEKALRRPSITAGVVAGAVPFHDRNLDDYYNAAGINIDIPIFGGGALKARAAEAGYRARASDEQLRNAENDVVRDIRVAWLNAESAYQRIDLAAQLVSHARESLDLAQERYRLGLSSIVELSQAVLSVTAAEIENASAKFEYLIQRSVLEYESGRLH